MPRLIIINNAKLYERERENHFASWFQAVGFIAMKEVVLEIDDACACMID